MPNFRHRLNRVQQRTYDRSNAAAWVSLPVSARLQAAVQALPDGLAAADLSRVQAAAQAVADEITRSLQVPPLRVTVSGTRPSNARGELHGLYTPSSLQSRAGAATIKVWMITAKRGQVVAYKTFLRTLLHEICHHLDYALLHLSDSFHTDGFYKRESSLFHQIGGATTQRRGIPDPRAGGDAAREAAGSHAGASGELRRKTVVHAETQRRRE